MIEISPRALGEIGKRILGNISKYIVDKPSRMDTDDESGMTSSFLQGHFNLLADEPHADQEIGADTRVKVNVRLIVKTTVIDERFLISSVNWSKQWHEHCWACERIPVLYSPSLINSSGNPLKKIKILRVKWGQWWLMKGERLNHTCSSSESEIIYIRLCGVTCLLKLICNSYFYSRVKPDDFLLIMTLLRVGIVDVSVPCTMKIVVFLGSIVSYSSTNLS